MPPEVAPVATQPNRSSAGHVEATLAQPLPDATPSSRDPIPPATPAPSQTTPQALSIPERLLAGIDSPRPFAQWQPGSRVLYSLELQIGNETLQRYILLESRSDVLPDGTVVRINEPDRPPPVDKACIQVSDADDKGGELIATTHDFDTTVDFDSGEHKALRRSSPSVLVRVAVYDETGTLIGCNHALLPEAFVRKGMCRAIETAVRYRKERASEPSASGGRVVDDSSIVPGFIDELVDGFAALSGCGRTIASTPVLNKLARRIVPPGSVVQTLLRGRLDVNFAANFAEATPTTPHPAGAFRLPGAYHLPITIRLNGEDLMHCAVDAVPPDPPLHMSAGILTFVGARVDDPSLRFELHLLAARHPSPQMSQEEAP